MKYYFLTRVEKLSGIYKHGIMPGSDTVVLCKDNEDVITLAEARAFVHKKRRVSFAVIPLEFKPEQLKRFNNPLGLDLLYYPGFLPAARLPKDKDVTFLAINKY